MPQAPLGYSIYAIGALWWVACKQMEYGAVGSGWYIDPGAEPMRFAQAVIERTPLLLAWYSSSFTWCQLRGLCCDWPKVSKRANPPSAKRPRASRPTQPRDSRQ